MDAALDLIEAGPAARALILTLSEPARARLAPDRTVTLILQRVIGNPMVAQVVPDRLARPAGHRIELDDVAPGGGIKGIDFKDADAGPRVRLFAAQPRN